MINACHRSYWCKRCCLKSFTFFANYQTYPLYAKAFLICDFVCCNLAAAAVAASGSIPEGDLRAHTHNSAYKSDHLFSTKNLLSQEKATAFYWSVDLLQPDYRLWGDFVFFTIIFLPFFTFLILIIPIQSSVILIRFVIFVSISPSAKKGAKSIVVFGAFVLFFRCLLLYCFSPQSVILVHNLSSQLTFVIGNTHRAKQTSLSKSSLYCQISSEVTLGYLLPPDYRPKNVFSLSWNSLLTSTSLSLSIRSM